MVRLPPAAMRPAMHGLRLGSLRPILPLPMRRAITDIAVGALPRDRSVRITRGGLGGVPARRLDPSGRARDGAILYLHGGGYVVGSAASYAPLASRLAGGTRLPVALLDYRRAPEHPFPAAYDDALTAYRALRRHGLSAGQIVLAGDSAGGGLALALAMGLRDEGETPRALALICPWVDLTESALWRTTAAPREPLLDLPATMSFVADYAPMGTSDPRVSPARGDFAGLPPIIVHTAGDDILTPDATLMVRAAAAAGVPVEHIDHAGLWHDFPVLAGVIAPADAALDALIGSLAAIATIAAITSDQP